MKDKIKLSTKTLDFVIKSFKKQKLPLIKFMSRKDFKRVMNYKKEDLISNKQKICQYKIK